MKLGLVFALALTGCAVQATPDEPPAPLTCVAELWDGGPRIGPTSAIDGGAVLCPEGAQVDDPCVVPFPTVDHVPGRFGYDGRCTP